MESRLVLVHCLLAAILLVDVKCQIVGRRVAQDPSRADYWILAQETLIKYVVDNKVPKAYDVLQMNGVTTQIIVAGVLTELDFNAVSTDCFMTGSNCKLLMCHSTIFERKWLNKKEITVNCVHDI